MASLSGALWRGEVEARVERLRAQAATISRVRPEAGELFFQKHVIGSLDEADRIRAERQTLATWWTGALIEDAWRHIRHAEESLVAATPDLESLKQHATRALARAKETLPADDAHIAAVTAAMDTSRGSGGDAAPGGAKKRRGRRDRGNSGNGGTGGTAGADALRRSLLSLLDVVNTDSAHRHQRQRGLRNRLRIVTIGLGLGALVAVAAGLWWWKTVPAGIVSVPADIEGGSWLTLAVLAGAVGAFFSAVPSLSLSDVQASSFDTTAQQALLKIVVGAWSGPLGLIAITAGLGAADTDGTNPNGTLAGFLLMAALFGAGQEAITRFADQKAENAKPTP